MMRRATVLFACMILCGISAPSHAAVISCAGRHGTFTQQEAKEAWPSGRIPIVNVTCSVGYFSGEISKGDFEKVANLISANAPFLGAFALNSAGGSVDEALKIGRLFRENLILTEAPFPDGRGDPILFSSSAPGGNLCNDEDCVCASACALIWFGGVGRIGTVGLHRPRNSAPAFRQLSPADASSEYRQTLGDIVAYLDEMEVPKPIIQSMTATSSGDIRWVSDEDGLGRPPSIAEWEDASCGPRSRDYEIRVRVCEVRLLSAQRDRQAGFVSAWRFFTLLPVVILVALWLIRA